MKAYIGTSGFAVQEWKGKFYPEKLSSKEMLSFYSQKLNTVEINNTFYHMPRKSVVAAWSDQVRSDFLFAFKAPQIITHIKQMRNVADEISYIFRALKILGEKLGPILFQYPKSFRPHTESLKKFLSLLPDGVLCAFEFRNKAWLDDEVLGLLHEKGCSLCIADTDEDPAHEIITTAGWGYLRLRRADYTGDALLQWKEKILSQKWDDVFIYFKHEDEASGPRFAMQLQKLFDADVRLVGKKAA